MMHMKTAPEGAVFIDVQAADHTPSLSRSV